MRFAILVPLLACSVSAGPLSAQPRATGDFHAVELRGTADVNVRLARATSVEVSADADVLGRVTTDVKDGTLVIATHGVVRSAHAITVTVSTPSLDAVSLTGTGRLTVAGIDAPAFAASLTGTGEIDLAGQAGAGIYAIEGTGDLRAKDLAAKSATGSMEGTGSLELTATDQLTISVDGTGDVEVFGHPRAITKSIHGVGNVRVH